MAEKTKHELHSFSVDAEDLSPKKSSGTLGSKTEISKITCKDIEVSGNITLSTGDVILTAGNVDLTAGNVSLLAGWVDLGGGAAFVGGANSYVCAAPSDKRLKTNIKKETLGLNFLKKLKPSSWEWKKNANKKSHVHQDNKIHRGLVVQDLIKALAEENIKEKDFGIISKNNNGYYNLNSVELSSIIIKAVQDLSNEKDKEINSLNKRLDKLEKELTKLKGKI